MSSFVILGGGIAGLSAANSLVDRGEKPILIEAAPNPTIKVCGEFFPQEALTLLEKWNILPTSYGDEVTLHYEEREAHFKLHKRYGRLPRLFVEESLLQRLREKGATLLLGKRVQKIDPSTRPSLFLEDGTRIHCDHLFISTGRWRAPPTTKQQPLFWGCKNHFSTNHPPKALQMAITSEGYIGLSAINPTTLVVAGVVRYKNNPLLPLQQLIENHPSLRPYLQDSRAIMPFDQRVAIRRFGAQHPPAWPHCYFIGDAAATVPPILGRGMTLAFLSGHMAVNYALSPNSKGGWQKYRADSQRLFAPTIRWSSWLHSIAFTPSLLRLLFPLLQHYPKKVSSLHASLLSIHE